MLYLVQADAAMQSANKIDAGEGPGAVFGRLVERFKPESVYGNPSQRQIILIVNLDTPTDMAELMYVLTWFTGVDPTFTPLMKPEIYGEAIQKAKLIVAPPT